MRALIALCCLALLAFVTCEEEDPIYKGRPEDQKWALCPKKFGYHPDPWSPFYFIQCSNGIPYRFICPKTKGKAGRLSWNQKILTCDWNKGSKFGSRWPHGVHKYY